MVILLLILAFILWSIINSLVAKSKISRAQDIAKSFPEGVRNVIGCIPPTISYDTAVRILNAADKIRKAQSDYNNAICKEYRQRLMHDKAERIRQECPDVCEGKSDEYIVNNDSLLQEEEYKFKKSIAERAFWYSAMKSQMDFLDETLNLIKKCMPDWGRVFYSFKHHFNDIFGNSKDFSFYVLQTFRKSCCLDDNVSYELFPSQKNNREYKTKLENSHYYFPPKVWEPIISLISELKDKYKDDLVVIFANTECLSEKNYKYLINLYQHQIIGNANIDDDVLNPFDIYIEEHGEYFDYGETLIDAVFEDIPTPEIFPLKAKNKKIIIIDLITKNENLINRCESIFNTLFDEKSESTSCATGIVYISFLKCYDGAEIEKYNKDTLDISKAKNLAEKYPAAFMHYFPEQSVDDIKASQAKSIIEKESLILDYEAMLRRIISSVSGWNKVSSVPHYFFYYYYPTRYLNVSSDSETARQLVYLFKDGIEHSKIKDIVVDKIRNTFNDTDISQMTFVCIPASTSIANKYRYEEFSQEVSQELGMNNGYEHITITKEKTPSHLGGTDDSEYSFDDAFFNGKLIILFDDIVTRGHSITSMKSNLESLGSIVICAISIGRTFSDWNGQTPKPHPYTGNL